MCSISDDSKQQLNVAGIMAIEIDKTGPLVWVLLPWVWNCSESQGLLHEGLPLEREP